MKIKPNDIIKESIKTISELQKEIEREIFSKYRITDKLKQYINTLSIIKEDLDEKIAKEIKDKYIIIDGEIKYITVASISINSVKDIKLKLTYSNGNIQILSIKKSLKIFNELAAAKLKFEKKKHKNK